MTAYYMDFSYGPRVLEISYEKETAKMLVGVTAQRVILGSLSYVASKVDKSHATADLQSALDKARSHVVKVKANLEFQIRKCDELLVEIGQKGVVRA